MPPDAPALHPVSWAGESDSRHWMDVGREYTERWHHQMQIRDAVGAPGLLASRWMAPLLDLSVRALPLAYAATDAPAGTTVTLAVLGETAGAWTLRRAARAWRLHTGRPDAPDAIATLSCDDAWRLLYNALPPDEARRRLLVEGDARLVEPLLRARSVIV